MWVDEISLYVLPSGARIKTCHPGSRSPGWPGWLPVAPAPLGPRRCLLVKDAVIEADRMVNLLAAELPR